MKKAILLMVAALALTSISAVAQNKVDKQGRRQGHWVRIDKDGSKIFEGDFVDGRETGTFTYYYHDGSVRMKNTYLVAGRLCSHEAYDEQGRLLARGFYNQRNRDSIWNFYAPDGRLVKTASYKMGVKDGIHIVFNRQGDTAEVATWKNNHRNGRWWKRIGDHGYITANYLNGGVEGRLVEYGEDGKLVREGYYHNGLKNGTYRFFEEGRMTVDEHWENGLLGDRKIRLLLPAEEFVSVFDIACLAPKGKHKVVLYLKDGSRKETLEDPDLVYNRIGNELFEYANRKSRVMVARKCVVGLMKDNEGRDILKMDPQPDFAIYPDEDGLKMVHSRQFDGHSVLDEE